MKGYDERFLSELKSKNDIVSVISSYVPLEQRGSNYWGRCPFHHEKTPSFCVNGVDNFYYCFGCHKSGDVISFVMEIENIDFGDAVKLLAERVKMELPERTEDEGVIKEKREKKERLLSVLRESAKFYYSNLKTVNAKTHLTYLASRGFNEEIIQKFAIGASLDFEGLPKYLLNKNFSYEEMVEAGVVGSKNNRYFDALGGRLIIPVVNQMNQVVAFCGRILETKGFAKYVNTKETPVFSKSNILFNINNLKKLKNEEGIKNVIIVEGHMDVISLVKAGFNNVVASMGTSLTKAQARILKRYSDNVLISYDGDFAGQKASIRGLEILKEEGLNVKVVTLPDGMDPDDVITKKGKDEYQKLLDSAMPLIDFKLYILKNTYDLSSKEEKRKYISEALKVIKSSQSASEREDLLKTVRAETGITYESLKRELENIEISGETQKAVEINVALKEKNTEAERFVLYSFLFNKKYAENFDISDLTFTTNLNKKVAENVYKLKKEKKEIFANLFYDIVDESEKKELSEILAQELVENKSLDEEKYFKDCVKTMKRTRLQFEIDTLTKMCEEEKDIGVRKDLTIKLLMKTAEIKKLV